MAQANVAHEPTMEEILASIRQIISEDSALSPSVDNGHHDGGERVREQRVSENNERAPQPRQTAPQAAPPHVAAVQPVARPANEPRPQARPPEPRPQAASRPHSPSERPLLSADSNASVSQAFSTLTHTILSQNARTLEDLVGDLLQPMLREWLDANLPGIVERQVRQEIERISRPR